MRSLRTASRPAAIAILALAAWALAVRAGAADAGGLSVRTRALPLERVAGWTSPRVDAASLLEEDAANASRRDRAIPLRAGVRFTPGLTPANAGTWEDLDGGDRLWRLRVRSQDALWLVAGFDEFRLRDGGELRVLDASGEAVLGPYTASDVRDHGELWTPPIEGEEILLELYWPASLRDEEPRLRLGTVSHGYRPFGTIGRRAWIERSSKAIDGIGDSGACNIDINCPLGADWQDEKRGVVILLTSLGTGFCTGSMVRNTADDCRPYVLTAAHCNAGISTAYGFHFERSECGTGDPPAPTTQMVSGGVVRASWATSDFTLLEMSALPPEDFGFYLNGWSRDTAPPAESFLIHHPSGDVKKISHDDDPSLEGVTYGTSHWRIENYEEGTSEFGSSGAPVFDPSGHIRGQLHGGTASCTSLTFDEYGKLAASWSGGGTPETRLSDWLDPLGAGVASLAGWNGASCYYLADGSIRVDRSRYACSDKVGIALRDDDLQGNPTQAVSAASDTEPVPETVLLVADGPDSGRFRGAAYLTDETPSPGDGRLSVSHGDTIAVTYLDADDGQGGTSVPKTATATVDCLAPAISGVTASDVTGTSARISWTTDEPSDGWVRYGVSTPPGFVAYASALVTDHSIDLTGLTECSVHRYSVTSADAAANVSIDDAGGSFHTFSTGKNVTSSLPSSTTPIPIPDNNASGATSTIAVTDTRTVVEVRAVVNVTHPYDGDLVLSLIAPNGTVVSLSNRRGGSGDNYRDTVFDDAAAVSIASGVAPFPGSYRPESPLSAATGIPAAGSWRLKVADLALGDTGRIDHWTLLLRFQAESCPPHAAYRSHALVDDACAAGGPGDGDGVWDAGETIDFSVTIENDGVVPLTGVTATLAPETSGVTMLTASATFPDLEAGEASPSDAPNFRVLLSESLSCGDPLVFEVLVQANEGSWTSSFEHRTGAIGPGIALDEDFSSGIPAGWTIVDGGGGGGVAATWTTANPGARSATWPVASPFAVADSDAAGSFATQDEELIAPVFDLSGATAVTLEFDESFRWYAGGGDEKGDVDVRSSLTGGAWVHLLRNEGASSADPGHRTIDLTAHAAGAPDVEIRFRYYDAAFDWYWQIDNVKVSYESPGSCAMTPCGGALPPPPVPDGSFGIAFRASRGAPDGSAIDLAWDVATCPAVGYHLLFGSLSGVSTYTIDGAACAIGAAGAYSWTGVPAGNLWFVVVSDDGAAVEGSWGRDGAGAERGGATCSGRCSLTIRSNDGTCP